MAETVHAEQCRTSPRIRLSGRGTAVCNDPVVAPDRRERHRLCLAARQAAGVPCHALSQRRGHVGVRSLYDHAVGGDVEGRCRRARLELFARQRDGQTPLLCREPRRLRHPGRADRRLEVRLFPFHLSRVGAVAHPDRQPAERQGQLFPGHSRAQRDRGFHHGGGARGQPGLRGAGVRLLFRGAVQQTVCELVDRPLLGRDPHGAAFQPGARRRVLRQHDPFGYSSGDENG